MAEKGWNSEKCDPLGDIEKMIEYAKGQSFDNHRVLSIRKPSLKLVLEATGLKTAKEIEQKYFELYDEVIKIKIC